MLLKNFSCDYFLGLSQYGLLTLILTASKPQPISLLEAEKSNAGGGGGSAFSAPLKICWIKKREFPSHYHQKLIENDVFRENIWYKKFAEVFFEAIFI
jgi:hypothetical protein